MRPTNNPRHQQNIIRMSQGVIDSIQDYNQQRHQDTAHHALDRLRANESSSSSSSSVVMQRDQHMLDQSPSGVLPIPDDPAVPLAPPPPYAPRTGEAHSIQTPFLSYFNLPHRAREIWNDDILISASSGHEPSSLSRLNESWPVEASLGRESLTLLRPNILVKHIGLNTDFVDLNCLITPEMMIIQNIGLNRGTNKNRSLQQQVGGRVIHADQVLSDVWRMVHPGRGFPEKIVLISVVMNKVLDESLRRQIEQSVPGQSVRDLCYKRDTTNNSNERFPVMESVRRYLGGGPPESGRSPHWGRLGDVRRVRWGRDDGQVVLLVDVTKGPQAEAGLRDVANMRECTDGWQAPRSSVI